MKEYVKTTINEGVGTIEFFHPQSNSLPGHILSELSATITKAGKDNNIQVIILKSAGDRAFCAGASFDELIAINNETLISRLIKILIKYKAKKISILVGYKSYLIKKELKKIKNINFKYIQIDYYRKYGHGFTWYKYKNYWKKERKKFLYFILI